MPEMKITLKYKKDITNNKKIVNVIDVKYFKFNIDGFNSDNLVVKKYFSNDEKYKMFLADMNMEVKYK